MSEIITFCILMILALCFFIFSIWILCRVDNKFMKIKKKSEIEYIAYIRYFDNTEKNLWGTRSIDYSYTFNRAESYYQDEKIDTGSVY